MGRALKTASASYTHGAHWGKLLEQRGGNKNEAAGKVKVAGAARTRRQQAGGMAEAAGTARGLDPCDMGESRVVSQGPRGSRRRGDLRAMYVTSIYRILGALRKNGVINRAFRAAGGASLYFRTVARDAHP